MAKKYEKNAIGGMLVDKKKEEVIKELIYNQSKENVLMELDNIEDAEIVHVYMWNYNWDDGFDIPQKILAKDCCELSTALLIFYLAGGEKYLLDKVNMEESKLSEWSLFLQDLYNQIMNGKFKVGNIYFESPLSKVQLYKIKKNMKEGEEIFVDKFGEKNLNIVL